MNTTLKSIVAAVIALGAASAFAQSSKVDLKNTVQLQAGGMANKQEMNLGNVKNGGTSKVNATNTVQLQAGGMANKQEMNAGNVEK